MAICQDMKSGSEGPNKIRVVHVIHSFGIGGMEKGIATLIRNSSDTFQHAILCLSTSGQSERLLPPETKVYALGKAAGNSFHFLMKLGRQLRTLKPDVVHTRNWGGMDGIIASRLAGIRSVVHGEHGWDLGDPEGKNLRRVMVRRFLSSWVRELTCVSQNMKGWLIKEVGIKKPVNQVYNGIDSDVFRPCGNDIGLRAELGIPEKSHLVGVIGRLDPIKDHPTLFRAFAKVKESVCNARLLVVGDGTERRRLESAAGEDVLFLGSRSDVPRILSALDVFILPSLNEGISNTILEAMASGIPVIATRVGGNVELVEDGKTGFLVPPRDWQEMALAMMKYLADTNLRASHGKSGRLRVGQHFSVEQMVRGYEAVYRRIAFSLQL